MSEPTNATTPPGERARRRFAIAAVLLGVYWIALFVGTHLPGVPQVVQGTSDKLLHFAAYAGLAFLVALSQALLGRLTYRRAILLVLLLAIYGVLDELTQTLVGRHADWRDWVADVLGILTGVTLLIAVRSVVRALRRAPGA